MHRLWVHLTCNWFVIGWLCWRKGHAFEYRDIALIPQRKMNLLEPGRVEVTYTGKHELLRIYSCERCGYYQGVNRKEI